MDPINDTPKDTSFVISADWAFSLANPELSILQIFVSALLVDSSLENPPPLATLSGRMTSLSPKQMKGVVLIHRLLCAAAQAKLGLVIGEISSTVTEKTPETASSSVFNRQEKSPSDQKSPSNQKSLVQKTPFSSSNSKAQLNEAQLETLESENPTDRLIRNFPTVPKVSKENPSLEKPPFFSKDPASKEQTTHSKAPTRAHSLAKLDSMKAMQELVRGGYDLSKVLDDPDALLQRLVDLACMKEEPSLEKELANWKTVQTKNSSYENATFSRENPSSRSTFIQEAKYLAKTEGLFNSSLKNPSPTTQEPSTKVDERFSQALPFLRPFRFRKSSSRKKAQEKFFQEDSTEQEHCEDKENI